jgi:putative tryptophan/tyrosine transport system substrate-binding protein
LDLLFRPSRIETEETPAAIREMIEKSSTLLAILALGTLFTAAVAEAQQAPKPVVGVLSPGNPPPADPIRQREAFEDGLRARGWNPGVNVIIEYRYAEGRPQRLPALAAELVRMGVDVIVGRAPASVRAAQEATRTIPIVMSAVPDPVREGFVASLARPGGNITGLTLEVQDLEGKQLELLRDTLPKLTRVGILRNMNTVFSEDEKNPLEEARHTLGLDLKDFPISGRKDLVAAFAAMSHAGIDAVLVRRDPLVLEPNHREVAALTLRHRLPAIHHFPQFVEAGSLMSYGVNIAQIHRRSAAFVDKILKGAKAADLPVEHPAKLELAINTRTAKTLGLTLPQSVLVRVDRVIE